MKAAAAGGAEIGVLEIEFFDGVGGDHDAAPIVAVAESLGVAEFVEGLLDEAEVEGGVVGWEAVELLAKAVEGDEGGAPGHLGFAEDEGEDGDVEVGLGDAEQGDTVVEGSFGEAGEQGGGVGLAAEGIEGELAVEFGGADVAGDGEAAGEGGGEAVEEVDAGRRRNAHQVDAPQHSARRLPSSVPARRLPGRAGCSV